MRQCWDPWSVRRTYASAIEHEVACFTVPETPEDGRTTKSDDGGDEVEGLYGCFGQYRVIRGGSP